MRRMLCVYPLAALLVLPASAAEDSGLTREHLWSEYKACMLKAVGKYGPKTDRVDDAIDAAKADCQDAELAFRADVYGEQIVAGKSAYKARQLEEEVMRMLGERIRPEMARAALSSK